MIGIAITIMIGALILYGVSGLVRRSGTSHILTIDYAKIGDVAALHQWAADRLRAVAIGCMVLAGATVAVPGLERYALFLFALLVVAVCACLGLGARRFNRP